MAPGSAVVETRTPQTWELKTTAYCGCQRCCGWEWGVAVGPLPVYLPLPSAKRASGQTTVPFWPRHRKETQGRGRGGFTAPLHFMHEEWVPPGWRLMDRVRGAALGAGVAAVTVLIGRASHLHLLQSAQLRAAPYALWGALQRNAYFGSLLGGTLFPVGRYWAETELSGHPYEGVTALGTPPREYRPPLLSRAGFRQGPFRVAARLARLDWSARDGTVAADTRVLPYGTRVHVPGYGWGIVEDQGGAITGDRVDLFIDDHERALDWGRRTVASDVYV